MEKIEEATRTFLSQKRIAVVGVSRHSDVAANIIYRKLRNSGYTVFEVNPNASVVEDDRCYENLSSAPAVEAAVIATPPSATASVIHECSKLGIDKVWIHRSFGTGSLSDDAVALCRELGISVIPGSCPMMLCEPVDAGHKCIRWLQEMTGGQAKPAGF